MQRIPGSGGVTTESSLRAGTVVLTIAGFDPSSGAGCTADLKVFAAHGLFGVACPTALTVQSTQGVVRSEAIDPVYLRETLECLAADMPIAGVKIGMLGTEPAVRATAAWLASYRRRVPALPVVLDPVLRASSGRALLTAEGITSLREHLLPLVTVLTPNFAEAGVLAGTKTPDWASAEGNARKLLQQLIHDGPAAVVLTGGDLPGTETVDDFLLLRGLERGIRVPGRRIATRATHGTGCAFSSAILCALVAGSDAEQAVEKAKRYVEAAMSAAYPVGMGRGPMHHLFHRFP